MADIQNLLQLTIDKGASDLHLQVGMPPCLRIHGELSLVSGENLLTKEEVETLLFSLLQEEQKELLANNKEIDFSFELAGKGRFRVNVYHQKGTLAGALRFVPLEIKGIDELGLPKICYEFSKLKQGFVLVTGPTGHGKSTTLAAIIKEILSQRSCNVITIEDPVEFVFTSRRSLISQRELGLDTHSWTAALRSTLREDPDVVLIGEMRDYDTIAAALTIAETGHLVFSTLHTNSASQTIDRIIDAFPEDSKSQVRMQLATALEAVLSQRLVPRVSSGRVLAYEIMVASPAVRTAIREGKTHMLDNIMQTSGSLGMSTLETSLVQLIQGGKISLDTARLFALRPEEVSRLMKQF
ncbi:MAG TPA: type IV pilus twitching motility protein PilT [Patescibacteria group bacterium]|nr:type IV pilus twitching motility protein PilT [Patescibacteria group bacterium]